MKPGRKGAYEAGACGSGFLRCVSGSPMAVRQRGVALPLVVWFIAGMSLLVAGMVSLARQDTKMAQLHLARAKAVAAGDGAVQLMLAERLMAETPVAADSGLLQDNFRLGDASVALFASVVLLPPPGSNAMPTKSASNPPAAMALLFSIHMRALCFTLPLPFALSLGPYLETTGLHWNHKSS